MLATLVDTAYTSLGTAEETFRCCDTAFTVHARGRNARAGVDAARRTAVALEGALNAFAEDSAVARLNRTGRVENEHVARIVRRALDYHERTDGVFDVRQGRVEHDLKAFIRGETDAFDAAFADGAVDVTGDTVTAAGALDLNGLAKGYVVDRAAEALVGLGRRGFVDGGGDIAHPSGPVAIESPYGDEKPIAVLDTDWNVASSGATAGIGTASTTSTTRPRNASAPPTNS
ncbi:FAD:protein FMN transferase [Halobacteriaceae archaeon GCM10025711]